MVRKDEATQKMLDDSSESEKDMHDIKKKLSLLMHGDGDLLEMYREMFKQEPNQAMSLIMKQIGNPFQRMHEMFQYI
jgi:hypothetical protein